MLTFLRKIRKSLIDSSSARKYLLYAFGEIALVVIGILIALQINNWNEERKQKILGKDYLVRLKQELNENILNAESGLYFQAIQNHCASRILSFLNEDPAGSNEFLIAYSIVLSGWTNSVEYSNNVWNELYSTGNARLIVNADLRERLIEVQKRSEGIVVRNKEFNGFNLGFRRLVGDVLRGQLQLQLSQNYFRSGWDEALLEGFLSDNLPSIMLTAPTKGNLLVVPAISDIKSKLSHLKGVEGYLADIIQGRQKLTINYNDLIQELKGIIELIDQEINR